MKKNARLPPNRHAYVPEGRFSLMNNPFIVVLTFFIVVATAASGCSTAPSAPSSMPSVPSPVMSQPSQQDTNIATDSGLVLQVESLLPGSILPSVSTCNGASESPGVSWDGIPLGSKSLVLILDDPDAPSGSFTHWIVYNIPPKKGGLSPAQPNVKVLPDGAQQGDTTAGSRGYYPPCPPIGKTHRYIFRLYAADCEITQPTADRSSIEGALAGHVLAKTEVITTFTR